MALADQSGEQCRLEDDVSEDTEGEDESAAEDDPEEPDDLEERYETVIDVTDIGADATGNESITPVLQSAVADDTLFRFPEGRYYMAEQLRFTNFENVGFVGENATLVPAPYSAFDGPQYRLFRLGTGNNPGRDLVFGGFEVDQTAAETGIRVVSAEVDDGLLVRDVTVRGVHDSGTWGPGLFNVTDPDGEGVVEEFHADDGAIPVGETPNAENMRRGPTGVIVDPNHRGTIVFRDCSLGGFPDNGLYSSNETGRVGVDGGRFENSGTASIRLNGTTGRIEDAIIVVDENPYDVNGQHAIRLDSGDQVIENVTVDIPNPNGDAIRIMNDVESASITNSKITVGEAPNNGVQVDPQAGPTTIEDVDIEVNGSANAVRILGRDAGTVAVESVRVTGDAPASRNLEAIFCERNDCRFVDLDLTQVGAGSRRGLDLRGTGALVADSDLETSATSIVLTGADDVRIENTAARAVDDGYSLRIIGSSGSVSLANNEFPDGVRDDR